MEFLITPYLFLIIINQRSLFLASTEDKKYFKYKYIKVVLLLPSQGISDTSSDHCGRLSTIFSLANFTTSFFKMDPEFVEQLFNTLLHTTVTKTIHRDVYPAISPSRPELSQAGRTVLITGGGTGVGHSIARSFVQASAATVIIIGRRADVLATSAASLEAEAKKISTKTKIVARTCDIVNLKEVEGFWEWLQKENIVVDVFVANAAKFTEPKSIVELGAEEVWSQMEVNVKSPLYFFEKFYKQDGEGQKVRLF